MKKITDEVKKDIDVDDSALKEEFRIRICENMLVEILSRTSLKTYDLLRCASKQLEKLTYDHYLLDLYKQRNDVVFGHIIQYKRPWGAYYHQLVTSYGSKTTDLTFLNATQVVASSEQGILVGEILEPLDYDSPILYICKPCSMDMKALRYPNTTYSSVKFAIVILRTIPFHYKIIRLSQMKLSEFKSRNGEVQYETFQFEMFDSIRWEWRELENIRLPFCVYPIDDEAIVSRGSVFMLLSNGHILRIDAYSGKCVHVLPPSSIGDYIPYTFKIVKIFGKLGYVIKRGHDMWDVWVITVDNRWIQVKNGNVYGYAHEWWDFCNHNLYFFSGHGIQHVVPVRASYEVFSFRSDFEQVKFTQI